MQFNLNPNEMTEERADEYMERIVREFELKTKLVLAEAEGKQIAIRKQVKQVSHESFIPYKMASLNSFSCPSYFRTNC